MGASRRAVLWGAPSVLAVYAAPRYAVSQTVTCTPYARKEPGRRRRKTYVLGLVCSTAPQRVLIDHQPATWDPETGEWRLEDQPDSRASLWVQVDTVVGTWADWVKFTP